jgi:hypothetical protein
MVGKHRLMVISKRKTGAWQGSGPSGLVHRIEVDSRDNPISKITEDKTCLEARPVEKEATMLLEQDLELGWETIDSLARLAISTELESRYCSSWSTIMTLMMVNKCRCYSGVNNRRMKSSMSNLKHVQSESRIQRSPLSPHLAQLHSITVTSVSKK